MRGLLIAAVVVALPTGWFLWQQTREADRADLVVGALDHGDHLEKNRRWSEAIESYRAALQLELTDPERADVRFRLARSLVEGNDLRGALGVLQDLTAEDVARFNMDIGPLYFRLAEKARVAGDLQLALIANRQGTAVSPARTEQFMGQREGIADELHAAPPRPAPDDPVPDAPAPDGATDEEDEG